MTDDWRQDALCREVDPELFFPPLHARAKDAKRVCAACDVAAECLADALDNEMTYGIWGGLSPKQRRRLRRQNGAAA